MNYLSSKLCSFCSVSNKHFAKQCLSNNLHGCLVSFSMALLFYLSVCQVLASFRTALAF
jgi:hypothetical protein